MAQTVTFEVIESDAHILQALLAKAQQAGKSITEVFAELRQNGKPLTLAVDGGPIVLQDQVRYEKLLNDAETAAAVAGINRGLESMRAGKSRPAQEVFSELRKEFNLPESSESPESVD